jgi:cell pole-organizing protein PopZ
MADDYEILPSDEVEYLRKEIEKIKAKPFGSDTDTLIGSIRQLQSSIDALVKVFAEANNIVSSNDFRPTTTNDPGVLSRLEMQNEKIAKSILNLAGNIRNQERSHKMEHQEFLQRKEPKEKPAVTSGIVPSGLAPLSAAPKQAEHDKQVNSEMPLGPKSHEQIPQKQGDSFSFNKGGADGDEELPEPPKPLY